MSKRGWLILLGKVFLHLINLKYFLNLTKIYQCQMTLMTSKIEASVMTLFDVDDIYWRLLTFYKDFNFWKIKKSFFYRCRQFRDLTSIIVKISPDFNWRHPTSNLALILFFDAFWRFLTFSIDLLKNRQISSKFIDYCEIIK